MGKKVTIITIANEVGMSTASVSRAFDPNSKLKPEKRELILKTAKQLGYIPNKMAARLPCKPIHIGVLIYGSIESYYNEYIRGINQSYDNFVSYKVDYDLKVLKKTEYTLENAYEIIDKFIEKKYDGVIISGFNNTDDIARINRLTEAKIPFIILDHDIADCTRSGVSMNDVDTAGRLAAQLLSAAMGFKVQNTAILYSELSSMAQKKLVDSFCNAAKEFDFKISHSVPTYNDYNTAYECTKKLLQDKSIKGIYVSTANSIAVCRCITEMNLAGKVKLVTSDIFDELNRYIENGTVFATIYQNPANQAQTAFDSLLYNILEQKKIDEFTFSSPVAVFKSNLNLYI